MRVFYLHFNKVAMQRGDPKVWSIQTTKGCFHAAKVVIEVPLESVFKKNGPQPRAKFRGVGNGYWIDNDTEKDVFLLTNRVLAETPVLGVHAKQTR